MAPSWRPVQRNAAEDIRSISAKSTKKMMKSDYHCTKVEDEFRTKFDDFDLSREWAGVKGETYLIEVSGTDVHDSAHWCTAKFWTCTRWGKDGYSKTFTLYPDKASGKIWWGYGASFYCEVGAEASSDVLSWYRPGARNASFVWRAKPGDARSGRDGSESTGSGGDSTAGLSCRSSSRSGSAERLESRPKWRPKEDGAGPGDKARDEPCEKSAGRAAERPARSEGDGGTGTEDQALTTADAPPRPPGAGPSLEPGEAVAASRHLEKQLANIRKMLEEERSQAAAAKLGSRPDAADDRQQATATATEGGILKLPEGFQPPPGLEAPPGLSQWVAPSLSEPWAQMHEFTVTLDKSSGDSIGAKLDVQVDDDATLRIKRIMKTGLLPIWNENNPQKQVKTNDFIVEVNGRRGLAATLIGQLMQFQVQEIVIGRKAPLNTQQLPKPSVGDAADSGEDERQDLFPNCFDSCAKEMRSLTEMQAQEHAKDMKSPTEFQAEKAVEESSFARTLRAAGRPADPLEGRWFDSCGVVGTIVGSTMHWAHQADDNDATTEVVLKGASVHMTFLGQTLSGALRGEQIIWSKDDVWRRIEPESPLWRWQ